MKKLLEVLMDDTGELHIEAEDLIPGPEDPDVKKKYDNLYKAAMRALTKCLWRDQDLRVSKAIRLLSMSEMACDRQPYEHVDQFFFTMMNSFLPLYEKYCNKLKKPYGFNPKEMVKPFTMNDFNCIQMLENPFLNESKYN